MKIFVLERKPGRQTETCGSILIKYSFKFIIPGVAWVQNGDAELLDRNIERQSLNDLLKNKLSGKAAHCVEASSGSVDLKLFKSLSQGGRVVRQLGLNFYIKIYTEKSLNNLLVRNNLARNAETFVWKHLHVGVNWGHNVKEDLHRNIKIYFF